MTSQGQCQDPLLVVGRINAPYGIKGWVRVSSYTREAAEILDYRCWYVGDDGKRRPYTVERGRVHGDGIVAHLASVDDRNQAEALRGQQIAIDDAGADNNGDGDGGFYWSQLQGLAVTNKAGHALGVVERLFETGANDVLVVRDESGHESLIPYLPQVVREVDLATGTIQVEWDGVYFDEDRS